MLTSSASVMTLTLFWMRMHGTCYSQGLCEDGFMDKKEGNHEKEVQQCTTDCAGGPYYANVECECACILSNDCTVEVGQAEQGLSFGIIALIVIAAICAIALLLYCCSRVVRSTNGPAIMIMPWIQTRGKLKEIPLTVHRHRGHYVDDDEYEYHPRNLLDKKGTSTYYGSDNTKEAVGDWIIFKIESQRTVIPTAVTIRNDMHGGCALYSTSLSLSVDGHEFEDFAVIQGTHRDNRKVQYLNLKDVMLSNSKIRMNDYKFIRLEVMENWGNAVFNAFYSFSVLGVESVESNERSSETTRGAQVAT